jgi:hypothetical protein
MKKLLTITAVLVACLAVADVQVRERISDIDGDTTITVTDYSRVVSVVGDVQVSGQTNTYTVSNQSIFTSSATAYTNTYAYLPSVADIQGSEAEQFYNSDSDANTDDAGWLKPGDVLTFSGSTQTLYKVVLEKAD